MNESTLLSSISNHDLADIVAKELQTRALVGIFFYFPVKGNNARCACVGPKGITKLTASEQLMVFSLLALETNERAAALSDEDLWGDPRGTDA